VPARRGAPGLWYSERCNELDLALIDNRCEIPQRSRTEFLPTESAIEARLAAKKPLKQS
jgi:hypothetical protein